MELLVLLGLVLMFLPDTGGRVGVGYKMPEEKLRAEILRLSNDKKYQRNMKNVMNKPFD